MISYAQWGNELYSGKRSYGIVEHRKICLSVGLALIVLSIIAIGIFGLNPGIDFKGGSEFTITNAGSNPPQAPAYEVLSKVKANEGARVFQLGTSGLRVQTKRLPLSEENQVADLLQRAYNQHDSSAPTTVGKQSIGPTFGEQVSQKAIQGLVIFIALVAVLMVVYFRTWTMALSAMVKLLHDFFITIGVFALTQFEVTPATIIGFLTILGYSLYDTVVVFDKIRENTRGFLNQRRYTYGELVNLSVNQTMVRSINTTIVAILPVSAILGIGLFYLGPGTLTDISLPLFVGMIVGTLSSIFIASPLLTLLRDYSKQVSEHNVLVEHSRDSSEKDESTGRAQEAFAKVSPVTPGTHLGQSAQPKRKGRKK